MEDQWKIYSVHKIAEGPLPTEINITGDIIGLIGPIIEPDPDYAFDPGFDFGFEENYEIYESPHEEDDYLALDGSPLSTQNQGFLNPNNSLRISAVEICNSGRLGPASENYINIYYQVPATWSYWLETQ